MIVSERHAVRMMKRGWTVTGTFEYDGKRYEIVDNGHETPDLLRLWDLLPPAKKVTSAIRVMFLPRS